MANGRDTSRSVFIVFRPTWSDTKNCFHFKDQIFCSSLTVFLVLTACLSEDVVPVTEATHQHLFILYYTVGDAEAPKVKNVTKL